MIKDGGSLQQLNDEVSGYLFDLGNDLRGKLLEMSGAVLRNLLFKDMLDQEFVSEGRDLKFWVRQEQSIGPGGSMGHNVPSLSFMLEGENRFRKEKQRLRILTPLPDGFAEGNLSNIAELDNPEVIFVERQKVEPSGKIGVLSRYLIAKGASMPLPIEDSTAQTIPPGLSETVERIPEELGGPYRILRDMVNWEARPQGRMVTTDTNQVRVEDL